MSTISPTQPVAPATGGLLVIGYGAPLRGDDAAGLLLASELDGTDGLTCLAVHQLTPDLAAPIAAAAEVIFVDAIPARPGQSLLIRRLSPHVATPSATSHACTPETLLALAAQLYGQCPGALILGLPALDLNLGERLSATTRLAMEEAKTWILHFRTCHA
jgi:hydrogenase maturation protease